MASSSCCHGPYAKGLMLADSTSRRCLESCIDRLASTPRETAVYFDKSRASSHTSQSSHNAGIAQLVERNLAKVEVASSRLVSRSIVFHTHKCWHSWRGGRVVMQRPAKPWTPVRFRPPPPTTLKPLTDPSMALTRRRNPLASLRIFTCGGAGCFANGFRAFDRCGNVK